jgi:hypothetical protein
MDEIKCVQGREQGRTIKIDDTKSSRNCDQGDPSLKRRRIKHI